MDYGRNLVDISPWMLFEATGDSEFDSPDTTGVSCTFISSECSEDHNNKRLQCMDRGALAEDDALSSSWDDDASNVNRCVDFDESYVSEEDKPRNIDDEGYRNRNEEEEEEDDEEEGAVDQVRGGGRGGGWRGFEKCWREQKARRRHPGAAVEVVMVNMVGRQKKRKGCREPAAESNSQRDTDRHFWEACLSS